MSTEKYRLWLEDWIKYHPDRTLSEREEKAFRLWYALVHASEYGYIDVNEHDDPTDAPDFISVIVRFLDEEHGQLRDLVREYQRLVNSYHECYPYPEDLAPSRDVLEERAKPFLEG